MLKDLTKEQKEMYEDLDTVKDLVILSESKGGAQLIENLSTDCISSMETLINQRERLTLQEFVALACDIKTRIDVMRSIKRAKTNKEFLEDIIAKSLQE